jgi:hypothetical protein
MELLLLHFTRRHDFLPFLRRGGLLATESCLVREPTKNFESHDDSPLSAYQ